MAGKMKNSLTSKIVLRIVCAILIFSTTFALGSVDALAKKKAASPSGTIQIYSDIDEGELLNQTVLLSYKAGNNVYNYNYFIVRFRDAQGKDIEKGVQDEDGKFLMDGSVYVRNENYPSDYKFYVDGKDTSVMTEEQKSQLRVSVSVVENYYYANGVATPCDYLKITSNGTKTGNSTVRIVCPGFQTASFKVRVCHPANYIQITSSTNEASGLYTSANTKLQLKANVGARYSGDSKIYKPSSGKLNWQIVYQDTDGNRVCNEKTEATVNKKGLVQFRQNCPAGTYYVYTSSSDAWNSKSSFCIRVTDSVTFSDNNVYYFKNVDGRDFSSAEAVAVPKGGLKLALTDTNKGYYIGIKYNSTQDTPTFPVASNCKICGIEKKTFASDIRIGGDLYKVYFLKPIKVGKSTMYFTSSVSKGFKAKLPLTILSGDKSGDINAARTDKKELDFTGGSAQPILEYRNPWQKTYSNFNSDILRYYVYVETDYDTDGDGKRDLLKVLMQVPRSAAEGDYKAAVIYDPTPYYSGFPGSTDKIDENVKKCRNDFDFSSLKSQPAAREAKGETTTLDLALTTNCPYSFDDFYYTLNPNSFIESSSWGYQSIREYDYFLVRGYAVAEAAGLGTYGSDGFELCGTELEEKASAAVVEWLHGDRVAYTDKVNNIEIKADFTNGNVAATGCSYGGTLPFEMASKGVEGLKTIVPLAGISSWYDYTNAGGVSIYYDPGYAAWLSAYCAGNIYEQVSGNRFSNEYFRFLKKLKRDEQDMSCQYYNEDAAYPEFYKERDYAANANLGDCSALIVHGLNDTNVQRKHSVNMYNTFKDAGKDAKLLFTLDAHGIPKNHKIMGISGFENGIAYEELLNRWFSHYLYGIDNGIEEAIAPITVQNNTDQTKFSTYENLDSATRADLQFSLYRNEAQLTETGGESDDSSILMSSAIFKGIGKTVKQVPVAMGETEIASIDESDVAAEDETDTAATNETATVSQNEIETVAEDEIETVVEDETVSRNESDVVAADETETVSEDCVEEEISVSEDAIDHEQDTATLSGEEFTGYIIDGIGSYYDRSRGQLQDEFFLDMAYQYPNQVKLIQFKDDEYNISGYPSITFEAKSLGNYDKNSRLMLSAVLIDYVDEGEVFKAQINRKNADMTTVGGEPIKIGGGLDDVPYKQFQFTDTRAKLISFGCTNLNMPNAPHWGNETNKLVHLKKDDVNTYNIYLDYSAYKVEAGHHLGMVLMTYYPEYMSNDEAGNFQIKKFKFEIDEDSIEIKLPEK